MGRAVLITGAGKGLGRAFAHRCAADGAAVVVNNRCREGDEDSAAAVANEIVENGGRAAAFTADVRDDGAPQAMVQMAVETFGSLDAVILNAGVSGPAARFERQSPQTFAEVMAINFTANVSLLQAALPALRASGAGRVVMVASTAGLYGAHGLSPYAASKGAAVALALSLAGEWRRDRIGVNVLCPYATTNMTPASDDPAFDAQMTADAVAPLASWMTSEACGASGEVWIAGGGHMARAAMFESAPVAMPDLRIGGDAPPDFDLHGAARYPNAMSAFRAFTSGLTSKSAA